MNFNRWNTDWDDFRQGRSISGISEEDFWQQRKEQVDRLGGSPKNEAERLWIEDGKPYYNVHPKLVDKFCKVNLSKVPTHLVEVPHDFQAVNIRLACQHPQFTISKNLRMPKNPWNTPAIKKGDYVHSFLMVKTNDYIRRAMHLPYIKGLIAFLLDFNVVADRIRTIVGVPLLWQSQEDSLEDSINACRVFGDMGNDEPYCEVASSCAKLAVTVGFLANSRDDLIEYDVLSKDRERYQQSEDEAFRKKCEEKACRRGKVGWNVGNDLMFLGDSEDRSFPSKEKNGLELQWSHIRQGHPHAVRYGPNKRLVKIMWFRPTRVRADLPFK